MLVRTNGAKRTSMATALGLFGVDLRLLGDLERQNDRDRGSDLATTTQRGTALVDLESVDGVENLQQALLLRFLTYIGELAQLGHPDYGSRLRELIGQLNIERNRDLAKLYTLQALSEEPRVREVLSVSATQNPDIRELVDINVSLKVVNSDTPLNLVFPIYLGAPVTP